MAGKIAQCLICLEEFSKKKSWQKFCSIKCQEADRYIRCRGTRKAGVLSYYHKNKEEIKRRRKENPNNHYIHWKAKLKANFNITPEIYMAMFDSQNAQCKICKKELKVMHSKTHVDHCHTTGKVRGLLCDNCNLGLGQFKDSITFLSAAINYLGGE